MTLFNEGAKNSLILKLTKRFNKLIEMLDTPILKNMSPLYKQEKRDYFNNLKENVSFFSEKVVNMLNDSFINKIIEDEDLNGLSFKEDIGVLIIINKKGDIVCELPFAEKGSEFIIKADLNLDFPIILGKGDGALFKNKLANLIQKNENELSSISNYIKNELEAFGITLFMSRSMEIESLKNMDFEREVKKNNNIRLNYGSFNESFLMSDFLETRIKDNFHKNCKKVFDFQDGEDLKCFQDKALKLNELLYEIFKDTAEVDYSDMFFNNNQEIKTVPKISISQILGDKRIEWYLFPDFNKSLESLNDLDVYWLDYKKDEEKLTYIKTELKHTDYINDRPLFLKILESIIFNDE